MDFLFDPTDEDFRQEVRAFIREKLPPEIAARARRGYHTHRADIRAWTKILYEKGWSVPGWPVAHGGTGWSLMRQFIFEQECFAAGAPMLETPGLKMIGPVIYTFGDDDQKRRFLEPFRRGDLSWGQCFSEPNAGSDLAALTTRAVRDGQDYVLNGRKIWTSNGHWADWFFCLVKTDPTQKQRGISMILIEAKTPGVTVRPIIDIGEGHSLNEVIFEDARTSAANLIGAEGQGWTHAKFLLEHERAFSAEIPRNKANLALLKRVARDQTRAGRPLAADPAFAARIAQLEAELLALEFMTLRALSENSPLPVGSILKIRGTELQQRIGELLIEALGDYGQYVYPEPDFETGQADWPPGPDYAPGLLADFMYRRAVTIYGGSNEIQRMIIARQFLSL